MNRRRGPRFVSKSQTKAEGKVSQESWRNRGYTPEDAVPKGSCQTMCPVREMKQRESQHRLHPFEMFAGTQRDRRPRADPSRTVKEYARPAAGKDSTNPSDLRPPEVLMKTVCYLIDEIAASQDLHPWTEVYGFVFDRLRAVKQDMIIQRVSGIDCVTILERTVRFLVYASYRLCGEPLRLYDPKINDTHMQENLSWLLDCYASDPGQYDNWEEFEALNLLYNLGCTRAMQHAMELPEKLRNTPDISLALSISRAFLERNPVRLLRLAQKLNFLQTCALHHHLTTSRRDLMLIYTHGFSSRNCRFPLDKLSKLLNLDGTCATQYCQMYGAEISLDNNVVFIKTAFTTPEQVLCLQYHNTSTETLKCLTLGCIGHCSET